MRLIDLHCNWALQYACETTQYEPAHYPELAPRLPRLEGYLMGTEAAVLAYGRSASDWSCRADPWKTLGEMIARAEAEFSGRLLIGSDDLARWRAEPADSLCWGMLAIEGFDPLVRTSSDLERLPGLFERGVRGFQLFGPEGGALGGTSQPRDDRGLEELGREFLGTLLQMTPPEGAGGPRPILDLAGAGPRCVAGVLDWFEVDQQRIDRVLLLHSRGFQLISDSRGGDPALDGLMEDNLVRLRAIGGTIGLEVGPPGCTSLDELRSKIEHVASHPFYQRIGYEGIGISLDFLRLTDTLPGLETVEGVGRWLVANFGRESAMLIGRENGRSLLIRAASD